jgi:hypothetical protein
MGDTNGVGAKDRAPSHLALAAGVPKVLIDRSPPTNKQILTNTTPPWIISKEDKCEQTPIAEALNTSLVRLL